MFDDIKRAQSKIRPRHVYSYRHPNGKDVVGNRGRSYDFWRFALTKAYSISANRSLPQCLPWTCMKESKSDSPLFLAILRSCLLARLQTLWEDEPLRKRHSPYNQSGFYRPRQQETAGLADEITGTKSVKDVDSVNDDADRLFYSLHTKENFVKKIVSEIRERHVEHKAWTSPELSLPKAVRNAHIDMSVWSALTSSLDKSSPKDLDITVNNVSVEMCQNDKVLVASCPNAHQNNETNSTEALPEIPECLDDINFENSINTKREVIDPRLTNSDMNSGVGDTLDVGKDGSIPKLHQGTEVLGCYDHFGKGDPPCASTEKTQGSIDIRECSRHSSWSTDSSNSMPDGLGQSLGKDEAARITYNLEPFAPLSEFAPSFMISPELKWKEKNRSQTKMIHLDFNLNALNKAAGDTNNPQGQENQQSSAAKSPTSLLMGAMDHQGGEKERRPTGHCCMDQERSTDVHSRLLPPHDDCRALPHRGDAPRRPYRPLWTTVGPYIVIGSLTMGVIVCSALGLNTLPTLKLFWDTMLQTALVGLLLVIVLVVVEANNMTDVVVHRAYCLANGVRHLLQKANGTDRETSTNLIHPELDTRGRRDDLQIKFESQNVEIEKSEVDFHSTKTNMPIVKAADVEQTPKVSPINHRPEKVSTAESVTPNFGHHDTSGPRCVGSRPDEEGITSKLKKESSTKQSQTEDAQCQSSSTQTEPGMIKPSSDDVSLALRVVEGGNSPSQVDASMQADLDVQKIYARTERMQKRHANNIRKMQKRFLALRRRCQIEAKEMKLSDRLKADFLSKLQLSIPSLQKEKTALMAEKDIIERHFEDEKRKNRELVGRLTKLNQQFHKLGKLQQPPSLSGHCRQSQQSSATTGTTMSTSTATNTLSGRRVSEAFNHFRVGSAAALEAMPEPVTRLSRQHQQQQPVLAPYRSIGAVHAKTSGATQQILKNHTGLPLTTQAIVDANKKSAVPISLQSQPQQIGFRQQHGDVQQQQRLPVFQLFDKQFSHPQRQLLGTSANTTTASSTATQIRLLPTTSWN